MDEQKPELKKEVKAEVKTEVKEEKKPVVPWGWAVVDKNVICTVPIDDPYTALGILFDLMSDMRERLAMARMMQEKRRQELAGKGTLKKGAVSNPGWFKKKFGG